MALASGHTFDTLDEELQQQYNKDFPGIYNDVIRLQPGNWIMLKKYLQIQDKVYNFKVKYISPFIFYLN